MSSLALAINRGGAGGGQQIRRQQSTSTQKQSRAQLTPQIDTRMSLASSIPPTSRRPKSYTHTLVEQRNKSKRLARQKQVYARQKKVYAPTPLALLSTSARKDPTLARNKQKLIPPDDRTDFGTPRTGRDSPRDEVDDYRDPPKLIIAISDEYRDPPKLIIANSDEPEEQEQTFIDKIGDAIVDANDAIVNLVFDNKAVTKAIFPYIGGDYFDGSDSPQESSVDFYTGLNQTLSQEGFEATPTSLYATQTNSTAAAGGEEKSLKKTGSKLGILMKREKKVKKDGNNMSETVQAGDVKGEAEPTDASKGIVDEANEAKTQGLTQEAVALLSIYEKSEGVVADLETEIDDRKITNVGEQVNDESTVVGGQDLEVEMLGDRNVLALGIGAFAVCGGDDSTVFSSDQREFTLQDYSKLEPILEDEESSILICKGEQKEKLQQKKLATLRGLRARNLRVAKKDTIVSTLQQERSLDGYSNEEELHIEEPIEDLTSENLECTLDDYSKTGLLQRISSFKSIQSNSSTVDNSFESKASTMSKALSVPDINKERSEQEVVHADNILALLAVFNDDALMLKSFEVDDGISMQSSISMPTVMRSVRPERQRSYPLARSLLSRLTTYSEEESKISTEENSKSCGKDSIVFEKKFAGEEAFDVKEVFIEESETSDGSYQTNTPWWQWWR